ncbi:MAG: cbb3-type cytochrome c oxidase subunit I [Nitrospinae bacterium]|nr:cbb3-type cytochrome c oxidase subunit I [Nitrospinota bacterium]
MTHKFSLPVPEGKSKQLAIGWLILAISTLVMAGFYALLLVLSRTPYIKDVFPWVDFFYTALVVHVDFTVLFWFLAFAGVFWSICSTSKLVWLSQAGLVLSAIGGIIIAAAPLMGVGHPLINNYIPVLQEPQFFLGLIIFGFGFTLLVIHSIITIPPVSSWKEEEKALRYGCLFASIAALISIICFLWSFTITPTTLESTEYYEILFWGGGHVLQFTHALFMVVVWIWLSSQTGIPLKIENKIIITILLLGVAMVFFFPWPYLTYGITSTNMRQWFLWLMESGGGIAALPIGGYLLFALLFKGGKADGENKYLRAGIVISIALFGTGGTIGFMIKESSTLITAHYHGTNVAVTLSFMLVAYYLLPRIGFGFPNKKVALIQVYFYGAGQLMHIIGLAWAGGYGMQRKIAGGAQTLDTIQQTVAMGLMGIGGVISVIGGLMFFFVVFPAMRRKAEN